MILELVEGVDMSCMIS